MSQTVASGKSTTPAGSPEIRIGRFTPAEAGPLRRARRWVAHRALRTGMRLFHWMVPQASARRTIHRRAGAEGMEVLLTGTFHAAGWANAHLRPLAASHACARLVVVSTFPLPPMPKVMVIHPPGWLRRLVGDVPARLLTFVTVALRRRPHVIGGFHLLVNGLLASVLSRILGGRSLYFCVGGPLELLDGGIWAENRLFGLMETPDPIVESSLIRAVGTFDSVITMGHSAVRFFRNAHIDTRYHVVPGGIDPSWFHPADAPPVTDLVLVGRLAEIKRIDIFLHAVALVSRRVPTVTATVVGDGELRGPLEALARELGLADRVCFVGAQTNVSDWLRAARVFVLTSDSEGLALSLMEAMMCGLPAIVSRVGDLGDLVEDGVNGYLVERRDVEAFAQRIADVLSDPSLRQSLSQAARTAALRYGFAQITCKWNRILMEWLGR